MVSTPKGDRLHRIGCAARKLTLEPRSDARSVQIGVGTRRQRAIEKHHQIPGTIDVILEARQREHARFNTAVARHLPVASKAVATEA